MDKRQKRRAGSFSLEERKWIIEEYLKGGESKQQIWERYTGMSQEHGNIDRWMRQLEYKLPEPVKRVSFVKRQELVSMPPQSSQEPEEDQESLKARINSLEKQLKDAQLQSEGYQLMIDLAEKQFNIPIRKKPGTK